VSLFIGVLFSRAAGKKRYIMIIPLIPFLIWSFFMTNPEFWKGIGTLAGMLAGYFIESEVIQFKMPKKASSIIFRIIIGLSVVLLLKFGIKIILPDSLISNAFRYFCIGLWVTAGAPAIFTKIKI
jgi:hypothetical protein